MSETVSLAYEAVDGEGRTPNPGDLSPARRDRRMSGSRS